LTGAVVGVPESSPVLLSKDTPPYVTAFELSEGARTIRSDAVPIVVEGVTTTVPEALRSLLITNTVTGPVLEERTA